MADFLNRLSLKLLAGLVAFLLVLSAATAAIIARGFRQTQDRASALSTEGLEAQGQQALLQIVEREAQIVDGQLAAGVQMTRAAQSYMLAEAAAERGAHWDAARLTRGPTEMLYDPSPSRPVEVWVSGRELSAPAERDLNESAVLDHLFPHLLAQVPDGIAIYYKSPHGVVRYYPVVHLIEEQPSDLVSRAWSLFRYPDTFDQDVREPVWTRPYVDAITLEPVVTITLPLYDESGFRGVVGVDVSLTRTIERVNELRPTSSGYTFLIDERQRLVAAPPDAVRDLFGPVTSDITIVQTLGLPLTLTSSADPALVESLEAMRRGESGVAVVRLAGEARLLSYAALPSTGWSLATVAPVAEITAQAEQVAGEIGGEAVRTLRTTLLTMGALFLVALLGTALVLRRTLLRPVETLVAGTRAVAAGDLSHRLPVRTRDELGGLAESFNWMANELAESQRELERRVEARTRELAALYDVTAVASESLDLATVLERSAERVHMAMGAASAAIYLANGGGDLRLVTQQPPGGGEPAPLAGALARQALAEQTPQAGTGPGGTAEVVVPVRAKGEAQGVLRVTGREARTFQPEEIALLASIADQIGTAVENARLYQQAERLAVVEERQRLARELHDAVTQSLYSVTLLAAAAQRAAEAGRADRVQELAGRLGTVSQQALREMRLLVYELRPQALEQAGLAGALRQRLESVEGRAGVRHELTVEGEPTLGVHAEMGLYRIAQEALNNALKHANASGVRVCIRAAGERLEMTISDDGQGFDTEAACESSGVGLASMRERAERLGGTLELHSRPGAGTTVRVILEASKQASAERQKEQADG